MAWTPEQQLAIHEIGHNILVSAGAGSGKTAVLTERVLMHLKRGVHIDELLILTFTKAAAREMKERIRKAIKKDETLHEELNRLETAMITTFDAYALSLVKKYHYLLNLPKNPVICDETFLALLRKKTLRTVLDCFYEEENQAFLEVISLFCGKNDDAFYNELLKLARLLEQKVDVLQYLKHLQEKDYEKTFEQLFIDYENIVLEKKDEFQEQLEQFSFIADKEYYQKMLETVHEFLSIQTYDEFVLRASIKLPSLPRGCSDEVKSEKEKLNTILKELKEYLKYGPKEELKQDYLKSMPIQDVLCTIFIRYFEAFYAAKKELGYFDFQAISSYALELLHQSEVLECEQNAYQEIMVDEYQDTNDFQEQFLNLLGKNNIYMVGDIKQSIYRFRNANPNLFKEKYERYKNQDGGQKIDLLKNFRSRSEVIANINFLFNSLMDFSLGGANYLEEHQMISGNMMYELRANQNYQMELWTYENDKKTGFSNDEVEAFFVAQDILKRVQTEQILDKETNKMRPLQYSDICILMDRATSFDIYRKVFQSFQIPITVYKDESFSTSIPFMVIKNIFLVLKCMKEQCFEKEFQMAWLSLERSFLFQEEDWVIQDIMKRHAWCESLTIKTVRPLLSKLYLSLPLFFQEVLQQVAYYEKIILLGNIEEHFIILEKMQSLIDEAALMGYTYQEFVPYLDSVIKEGLDVKGSSPKPNVASVKIMTIHKSKGLEFPVCYFSGLAKKFNIHDILEKFLWNAHYGFITPIEKEGITSIFAKELIVHEYLEEEIAEKIRLFYVALTRAKEKMIFVLPQFSLNPVQHGVFSYAKRFKNRSFKDFLENFGTLLTPFIHLLDWNSLALSKNYLRNSNSFLFEAGTPFLVQEPLLSDLKKELATYSKKVTKLLPKKDALAMELGKEFHHVLEYFDFQHPDFEGITNSFIKKKVVSLWHQPVIQNHLQDAFYQEYEFVTDDTHGIIDLFILGRDTIYLIDYKLQNTVDEAYKIQLKGYATYLEKTFSLPVVMGLYSLLDGTFTFLED